MSDLWTEKYRPRDVDDYVWLNDNLKVKFNEWVNTGVFPHLLLSGAPGTGKTSLALMLTNAIGIEPYDILTVNAARATIDTIRSEIDAFTSRMPVSNIENAKRIVLLNEVQNMSPTAQRILLDDMETKEATSRFILTCNETHKIIEPLKSRCQKYEFKKPPFKDFLTRAATILVEEGVEWDTKDVKEYCEHFYPDLRNCIHTLQQRTEHGVLKPFDESLVKSSFDFMDDVITFFASGKYIEARKILVKSAKAEEYDGIFRFLYDNIEVWSGDDVDKKLKGYIAIRDGIYKNSFVGDKEINLTGTLAELEIIRKD